jgi:inosine-uridine nucleoside N-ribohydrolase
MRHARAGNVTAGEFNAYADPEALRVVLASGVRLTAVGLE